MLATQRKPPAFQTEAVAFGNLTALSRRQAEAINNNSFCNICILLKLSSAEANIDLASFC
jgi:hypothetical protein